MATMLWLKHIPGSKRREEWVVSCSQIGHNLSQITYLFFDLFFLCKNSIVTLFVKMLYESSLLFVHFVESNIDFINEYLYWSWTVLDQT